MQLPIAWQWRRFDDLAPGELYALLSARSEVFVIEQRCRFLDADGYDLHAWHLLGWSGEPRVVAAYLRLIEPGKKFAEPSIGRLLTTARFRGRGLGREAMRQGLRHATACYPGHAVRISAQARLQHFYSGMGFETVSATYEEDGIEHIDMLRAAR